MKKLRAIIANNAALNNVLYYIVEKHMSEKEKREW
jgi:hypothetical protein